MDPIDIDSTDSETEDIFWLAEPGCTSRDHTRKQNCKFNPNCLQGYGIGKRGIWKTRHSLLTELGPDPADQRRKDDQPVGLRNLGATCYLNSMLQCLFMNVAFREGVFRWKPSEGLSKKSVTAMKQLQQMFLQMQSGIRSSLETHEFANSLGLMSGVQQDAEEFYNLFTSFLERNFAKNAELSVKNLLPRLFRGKNAYVTRCNSCHLDSVTATTFYQLLVSVKHNSVQEGLAAQFTSELMSGDNQYFCSTCNKKSDAERFSKLTELPPVLFLQLQRLLFDYTTMERSKAQDPISIPLALDFNAILSHCGYPLPEGHPRALYELRAVCFHQGRQASFGHYFSDVWRNGKWWRMNDAECTEVETVLQREKKSEEAKPKAKATTKRAKKDTEEEYDPTVDSQQPIEIGDSSSDMEIVGEPAAALDVATVPLTIAPHPSLKDTKSRNAYLLVYVRVGETALWDGEPPVLSEEHQKLVKEANDVLLTCIEEHANRKKQIIDSISTRKEFVRQFFDDGASVSVPDGTPDKEWNWVPSAWIKAFVCGEAYDSGVPKEADVAALSCDPPHMKSFLCCHSPPGILPSSVMSLKRIPRSLLEEMCKFTGPPDVFVRGDAFRCHDCCIEYKEERKSRAVLEQQEDELCSELRASLSPDDGMGVYVSKEWLRKIKSALVRKRRKRGTIRSTLTKLKGNKRPASEVDEDVGEPKKKKRRSEKKQRLLYHFMQESSSRPVKPPSAPEKPKPVVVAAVEEDDDDDDDDIQILSSTSPIIPLKPHPKPVAKKVPVTKPAGCMEVDDDEPLGPKSECLCLHGKLCPEKKNRLLVSSRAWALLKELGSVEKDLPPIAATVLPCIECQRSKAKSTRAAREEKNSRKKECPSSLKQLLSRGKPFPPIKDPHILPGSCPLPVGEYVFVPRGWLEQWREYHNNMEAEKPLALDLSDLWCPHGKGKLPFAVKSWIEGEVPPPGIPRFDSSDAEQEVELVESTIFETLVSSGNYTVDGTCPRVVVFVSDDDGSKKARRGAVLHRQSRTIPEICSSCVEEGKERLLSSNRVFSDQVVYVRRGKNSESAETLQTSVLAAETAGKRPTRASTTRRRKNMTVSHSDTVRTLRLKAWEALGLVDVCNPGQVVLFIESTAQKVEEGKTAAESGIFPRCTLVALLSTEIVEDGGIVDLTSGGAESGGAGFGGTLLQQ